MHSIIFLCIIITTTAIAVSWRFVFIIRCTKKNNAKILKIFYYCEQCREMFNVCGEKTMFVLLFSCILLAVLILVRVMAEN